MKVAIFGCSYTHGVPEIDNGVSWVKILSEKHKDIEFDNYAFMGSSVLFQLNLFKRVKHLYDKTLFQITTPGRITYWRSNNKNFLNRRIQQDNYSFFDYNSIDDVQVVTPGILKNINWTSSFWKTDKQKRKYAQLHYSRFNQELMYDEYEIYVEYIKQHSDFCFLHHPFIYDMGIPSIRSNKETENFTCDGFGHFKKDGHKWQAAWVKKYINIEK